MSVVMTFRWWVEEELTIDGTQYVVLQLRYISSSYQIIPLHRHKWTAHHIPNTDGRTTTQDFFWLHIYMYLMQL